MIKKLIFDIDNTLIDWNDENYFYAVTSACKKNGIEYSYYIQSKIKEVIDNYEKYEQYYDINKMHKLICMKTYEKLDIKFTCDILEYFSICVPENLEEGLRETLEYLSNKYELVAFSNWFEKYQSERMKKADIYKYFEKVYGAENIKAKPCKESFIAVCKNLKPEECVMVGDNLKTDVIGAIDAGLYAIFLNKKGKKVELDPEKKNKFKDICKIKELMKIL